MAPLLHRVAIKNEEKITGKAYDVNKQTIYIAPKSANESRVQYSLEPTHGLFSGVTPG